MSWPRQEVNKGVELAKNQNSITLADPGVQHADHVVCGVLNYKCFQNAIQMFERDFASTRSPNRTQLLKRLLLLLKGIETSSTYTSADNALADVKESLSNAALGPYDFDEECEPMNFRDAFLRSQALEGVVLSMILEPPNGEEVAILLQIFEISLYGGRDIHSAIVSSIQDLSKAFSSYKEEVLVKREELLQFAQVAISGLKINVNLERIDAEVSSLRQKLDDLRASLEVSYQGLGLEELSIHAKLEALYGALAHGKICFQLEERLLRKKKILHYGDTLEVHTQKVDKLKVLEAALIKFYAKPKIRTAGTRFQSKEISNFRVTEENEVGEIEQGSAAEITQLKEIRVRLESALKKVNISLAAASKCQQQTKEDFHTFDGANGRIVSHSSRKEGKLWSTLRSFRVESDVLRTWINFLKDAWTLQCSCIEKMDKQANDELEKHKDYYMYLSISLLSRFKNELRTAIRRIETFQTLKSLGKSADILFSEEDGEVSNPREKVEEEYMDSMAKAITAFNLKDNKMCELSHSQKSEFPRKDNDSELKELRDDVERFIQGFDQSIDGPDLQSEAETPTSENGQEIPSYVNMVTPDKPEVAQKEHPAAS